MTLSSSSLILFLCCVSFIPNHSHAWVTVPLPRTSGRTAATRRLVDHHHRYPQTSHFNSFIKNKNSNNNNDSTCLYANNNVDKGFNLLEIASSIVPQGRIVQTAKESWKFAWKRMMTELAPQDKSGSYQRPKYSFDGTIGSQRFPIEAGRYHVYVGNPCPWCHRVRLVANILGLQQPVTTKTPSNNTKNKKKNDALLGMTVLVDDPIKASRGGWVFAQPPPEALPQTKIQDLREFYDYFSPNFQGRCTAPVLVDWKTKQIVSNESKDIVRMLPLLLQAKEKKNMEHDKDSSTNPSIDLCPGELASLIDETNEWVYRLLNNGVYRCGFSTTQDAYDRASNDVLQGLNRAETILSKQNFLCSKDQLTESDIMLLPTMLRFDGVYAPFFGAGGKHVRLQCDYPSIFAWLQRCWNTVPGVATSIDIPDACSSYYRQLFPLNPGGILPNPVTAKTLRLEE